MLLAGAPLTTVPYPLDMRWVSEVSGGEACGGWFPLQLTRVEKRGVGPVLDSQPGPQLLSTAVVSSEIPLLHVFKRSPIHTFPPVYGSLVLVQLSLPVRDCAGFPSSRRVLSGSHSTA